MSLQAQITISSVVEIIDIKMQYQVSTSNTEEPTGDWSYIYPEYPNTETTYYLGVRYELVFSDGNLKYSISRVDTSFNTVNRVDYLVEQIKLILAEQYDADGNSRLSLLESLTTNLDNTLKDLILTVEDNAITLKDLVTTVDTGIESTKGQLEALQEDVSVLQSTVTAQQKLIDGEISTWRLGATIGDYANVYTEYNSEDATVFPPTLASFPAVMWNTDELLKQHELDCVVCTDVSNETYYLTTGRLVNDGGYKGDSIGALSALATSGDWNDIKNKPSLLYVAEITTI